MARRGERVLGADSFSVACCEAVFLGARFGYRGNSAAVDSFFKAHRYEPRSEKIFALYTWVADEAYRAREIADELVPDSLRKQIYNSVPKDPCRFTSGSASQSHRRASLLLSGLSFDEGIYHGTRSVPSSAEVISASRTPYHLYQSTHSRTPISVRLSRVPVVPHRRTLFEGSSRARV